MADSSFPTNHNLPAGYEVPGVYTSVILTDPGSTAPNNRALLWGYVQSGSPAAPNAAVLGLTQDDVDKLCGKGSMLSRSFASARAQAPFGAELWLMPLQEPASGTAATHLAKFLAAPVPDVNGKLVLGTNTSANSAAMCDMYIGSRRVASFAFKQGDTFATIAAACKAELDKLSALEVTTGIASDTLTFTDRHKGEHGNDLPLRFDISDPTCGVAVSPGTATFAAGPAGAAGTATLLTHTKSAQVAVASGGTDTASAGLLRDAINADSLPVYAAIPSTATGVVTLFYRSLRWVHRLSAQVVTIAPQTLTVAAGTAGVGTPSLTTALASLTADNTDYKVWSVFWTDISNWSSVYAHIEAQAVSPVEKLQVVMGGFTTTLSVLGNFPDSTSPKLNLSPRYGLGWYQGAPVRGWEVSARLAAMVAVGERVSLNYNFTDLRSSEESPILAAPKADRPTLTEVNTAITTYTLAPVTVSAEGVVQLLESRTTYKSIGFNDAKLKKWSCILTLDYYRKDLRAYLFALFGKDRKIKVKSPARTPYAITPEAVKAAVYVKVKAWDDRDLFDGAEGSRQAILAGVLVSPTRLDVALPMRPPADLDQISVVGMVS